MKSFLVIIFISFLLNINALAQKYNENDVVENQFYLSKKFQIDLPKG